MLTVTQMLREHGVVGKFVEFYGPGVPNLPLADRATIGNMSPEFGSTCAMFPIDAETLRYLEFSGRDEEHIALVEAYAREQGLWHDESTEAPTYSETLELDLGEVVPSLAGPKRPQDRVSLTRVQGVVPDGARRSRSTTSVHTGADEAERRVVPGLGPAGARTATARTTRAPSPPARARAACRSPTASRSRRRSRWPTAPRPSSTTATS